MDAKVLRAAVSAAIRVTVSTGLISCGGATAGTSPGPYSEGDPGGTSSGTPTNNDARKVAPANPYATAGKPTTGSTPTNTGSGGSKPAAGGAPTDPPPETGGMALGGEPATGGSPAGGSTSTSICGEPVEACMKTIEGLAWDAKPSEAEQACCSLVIDAIGQQFGEACGSDLFGRFQSATGRGACCSPDTWNNPACTPWGPPVPPELPLDALLAWGVAA